MSFYPYGGCYPYPCYPYYPYSLALLNNEYKLNGLYNELDELNDVEAQTAINMSRDIELPVDVSMNHGLHMQLKHKNHELVQHIVKKNSEIDELRALLKKHNIVDVSNNDVPDKTRRFYPPYYPYHYPYNYPYHYPYNYPYPYPYYRDINTEANTETHTVQSPPAAHVIIPHAVQPDVQSRHYVIPPHVHLRPLPCVLPPPPVPTPPQ
jgi:hypothetical protein